MELPEGNYLKAYHELSRNPIWKHHMCFLIKAWASSHNPIIHCCPVSLAEAVSFDPVVLKALSPTLLIICSEYKLKILYGRHMILMHGRHNIYVFLESFFPCHSYILPHAERTYLILTFFLMLKEHMPP